MALIHAVQLESIRILDILNLGWRLGIYATKFRCDKKVICLPKNNLVNLLNWVKIPLKWILSLNHNIKLNQDYVYMHKINQNVYKNESIYFLQVSSHLTKILEIMQPPHGFLSKWQCLF